MCQGFESLSIETYIDRVPIGELACGTVLFLYREFSEFAGNILHVPAAIIRKNIIKKIPRYISRRDLLAKQ
ncbi:hypothetical protein BW1_085_00100 [Bacillus mycoides NBRC 101238 = DSM 11821]|nr:hypothetical protein BW1_085_00100 [Bacillus mycoides NBRC 101238 = DSM 11821]